MHAPVRLQCTVLTHVLSEPHMAQQLKIQALALLPVGLSVFLPFCPFNSRSDPPAVPMLKKS